MKYALSALVLMAVASPAFAAENPFEGTIYQSIAAAIVFIVVFLVLKTKAWGPILQGLQSREEKIKNDLEEAERAAAQANETLANYQQQMAESHAEAAKLIDQAKIDAEKLGAKIKEQTQHEITAMKTRAENEINAAKEQALSDIYAQTAELATDVAGRILKKEINAADQQALVEASLAEFARTHGN